MVNFTIFAGSYTAAISIFTFDPSSSSLSLLSQAPAGTNPSWIALNDAKTALFATQENEPGGVLTFSVAHDGTLTQVSSVASQGDDPANLAILAGGKEVVVADYSTGGVLAFPIGKDGASLGNPGQLLTLVGSGPNAARQTGPHPHEVVQNGENELLVPDLGSDKVWRLARAPGNSWTVAGSVDNAPGSGPRHIALHDGSIYTLHELDNSLTQQTLPPLGPRCGSPKLIANVSVLPDGANPPDYGAAELIFSSGLLYASNRNVGPTPDPNGDTIAIVSTEPKLSVIKQVSTGLNQLRGVSLGGDQDQYIIAAGLVGGGVAIFEKVDDGKDLKLVTRYTGPGSANVSSFAWL